MHRNLHIDSFDSSYVEFCTCVLIFFWQLIENSKGIDLNTYEAMKNELQNIKVSHLLFSSFFFWMMPF
jgi:hypothetical protein